MSRRIDDNAHEHEHEHQGRPNRRDWIIIFVLLGIVALALVIIGTLSVIDSMDGTLGLPA